MRFGTNLVLENISTALGRCDGLWSWLKHVIVAGIVFPACLLPTMASAGAFRIFDQSASGTAQGGAFVAQADDPSAIFFNPAGMTQLRGVQTSFGFMFIGGGTSYTSPAGATAHGDFGGTIALPPPFNLYMSANLKDLGFAALGNLSAGIGVVSPFGILYRYPDDGPFSTAVTRQSLRYINGEGRKLPRRRPP